MPFTFLSTELPGVVLVEPRRFDDDRGWFAETYKQSVFAQAGIELPFVQDNHSCSAAGTVRGLHYQLDPHAQGKLVRVVRGKVWDVAVDIRRSSPTYRQWLGYELDAETGRMLYIPPGCAHGFVALKDETHLVYKCTAEYHSASERSIRYDDPDLNIDWPRATGREYSLSAKDAGAPRFADAEVFP